MKNIRILILALLLIGALATPVAAFPPQCDKTCTCDSNCAQPCAIGFARTTCDFWGLCQGVCFAPSPRKTAASQAQTPHDAIFAATPAETVSVGVRN